MFILAQSCGIPFELLSKEGSFPEGVENKGFLRVLLLDEVFNSDFWEAKNLSKVGVLIVGKLRDMLRSDVVKSLLLLLLFLVHLLFDDEMGSGSVDPSSCLTL